MAKKNKTVKLKKMRGRVMKRRLGRLFEFILFVGILVLEITFSQMPNTPDWFRTPIYYGVIFGLLAIVLWGLWVFVDTEETDLDKFEGRMEQLFEEQTKAINRLIKKL
ncbi:hypothetical protein ACFLXF_03515 [Chloroflexota bacterium]